jgi:hypothetical protein
MSSNNFDMNSSCDQHHGTREGTKRVESMQIRCLGAIPIKDLFAGVVQRQYLSLPS